MEKFGGVYVSGIKLKPRGEGLPESYVFSLPVVSNLGELAFRRQVTFFAGENGTGKSTLLEAIAVGFGFNAEGGSKDFSFSSRETHSALYDSLTIMKGVKRPADGFFLRAESFYNVASEVDRLEEDTPGMLDGYGGKSLHAQSHGESFMALMLNRLRGNGLYILDEPEAALSPSRQFALIARMAQLVRDNSQFIIATHSPILLAFPGADIYVIEDGEIRLTPYEETEHYRLTKMFLDNPERMLRRLCEEEQP